MLCQVTPHPHGRRQAQGQRQGQERAAHGPADHAAQEAQRIAQKRQHAEPGAPGAERNDLR